MRHFTDCGLFVFPTLLDREAGAGVLQTFVSFPPGLRHGPGTSDNSVSLGTSMCQQERSRCRVLSPSILHPRPELILWTSMLPILTGTPRCPTRSSLQSWKPTLHLSLHACRHPRPHTFRGKPACLLHAWLFRSPALLCKVQHSPCSSVTPPLPQMYFPCEKQGP